VCDGLVVYPQVIRRRVMEELPFMASENILMDAVKRGGDRQELHEKIRVHAQAAGRVVKEEGGRNDLLDRILSDPAFGLNPEDVQKLMDPNLFTGRSSQQVEEYLNEIIRPLLKTYDVQGETYELTV
jgi:adenylosuccinate lyase